MEVFATLLCYLATAAALGFSARWLVDGAVGLLAELLEVMGHCGRR
ncbi:MAG: hypothetical protein OXP28_01970 [Gammaproteobacteria bacterium]|nr:hypothetical protein [Gammaproteobacteria bacterium]